MDIMDEDKKGGDFDYLPMSPHKSRYKRLATESPPSTLPLFLRRGRGGNIRKLVPCFPVLGPSRVQPIAARVTDPRSQWERS